MFNQAETDVDILPIRSEPSQDKQPSNFNARNRNMSEITHIYVPSRDPLLIKRVKEYLHSRSSEKEFDINEMADHLQQRYREYSRRKRRVFQSYVKSAYEVLLQRYKEKNGEVTSPSEDDDDEDEEDDDVIETDVPVTNFLNVGLEKMYNSKGLDSSEPIKITISSDSEEEESIDKNNKDPEEDDSPDENHASLRLKDRNDLNLNLLPAKITRKAIDVRKRKNAPIPLNITPVPAKRRREITTSQVPSTTFKNIGGISQVLEDVCKLLVHIKHPEIYKQIGISPPRGFLLHGPPGCGKTLLANAIAGELKIPLLKVAAPELVAGVSGESEERIRDLFEQAASIAPCVLFIDEVDAITQNRQTAQKDMERRIVAQLLACLDDLNQHEKGDRVLVIGATNRPDSIDPALRRAGRFDREVSMGIPNIKARAQILQVLCEKLKLSSDFDFEHIAKFTPGYVGADLMAMVREASMAAVNRIFDAIKAKKQQTVENEPQPTENVSRLPDSTEASTSSNNENGEIAPVVSQASDPEVKQPKTKLDELLTWLQDTPPLSENELSGLQIEMNDFEKALKSVQPSAKREGFATVPDVTWDDVGSLRDVREELQMAILAPVRHAAQFESLGILTPTGVLLCGPPGCGKTLLAKAIANEAGINFISVKGPELLNMYVGESERAVRLCFQRARNSAPCVIFFDELDALCPKRSDFGENGATMRVVNQMLTEMDGIEGRQGVYLMAASNRPDIIDAAVLRPGRLDKIIYVGLPTAEDRVDILRALTKNGTKPKLAEDVDLALIGRSERCNGYTGADLAALVREASVQSLREYMVMDSTQKPELVVTSIHFSAAIGKIRPSVTDKDQKHYERLKRIYSATQEIDEMDVQMDDV